MGHPESAGLVSDKQTEPKQTLKSEVQRRELHGVLLSLGLNLEFIRPVFTLPSQGLATVLLALLWNMCELW